MKLSDAKGRRWTNGPGKESPAPKRNPAIRFTAEITARPSGSRGGQYHLLRVPECAEERQLQVMVPHV